MKRGESGLSLVVGVDKPAGMSSHDVVNRVRHIFGEKRVGHAGTLDPIATGALPLCIGPATRLNAYLTGHDKSYRTSIAFGVATDTDDAAGNPIRTGEVPARLFDPLFAREFIASLVGARKQLPPAYSAIKVEGQKSYEAARRGTIIDLAPRDIVVHEARLIEVREGGDDTPVIWDVEFSVSKGTYIRALARDVGVALGCPAHVAALRRTKVGLLSVEECSSLEALSGSGQKAALDPVRLLGYRFLFIDEAFKTSVSNGAVLSAHDHVLFDRRRTSMQMELCACTAGVYESDEPARPGEVVAALMDNTLKALYQYDETHQVFRPRCVFPIGVSRGSAL